MTFDMNSLLDEASRRAGGLTDFGDEAFRPALAQLLACLDREGRLSAAGRGLLTGRIVEMLKNRLVLEDHVRRNPDILDEANDDPIVIVGLPRTGTTLLQRILSCDPRFYPMLWWECRYPAPGQPAVAGGEDPRVALARAEVRAMVEANPALLAIHPFDAEAADEEGMLMEHSFMSFFDSYADIPGYTEWMWSHDQTPAYRHLQRMLKFIQWQKRRRGVAADRWVLKAPHHLRQIDVLFKVFPGAQVIQTHRDPLETIPSIASFVYNLWAVYMDQPDPARAGRQWSDIFARGTAATMAFRDAGAAERFLDIGFADTLTQPLSVVEDIYAFVGLDLPADIQERMQRYLEDNRREKRPAHDYAAAYFGLSAAGISRDFAVYRQRYILPHQA
ncbi:MAG: sulfotransferase [Rhodocyclaceae bacterium]|nr:sulfotransferase [Rhodocyclaceae bacterium]MBK7814192.1 sulfotransferase [Rhodocyclaceae bacterium]